MKLLSFITVLALVGSSLAQDFYVADASEFEVSGGGEALSMPFPSTQGLVARRVLMGSPLPTVRLAMITMPTSHAVLASQSQQGTMVQAAPVYKQPIINTPTTEEHVILPRIYEQPIFHQSILEQPILTTRIIEVPKIQPIITQPVLIRHLREQPIVQQQYLEQPVITPRLNEHVVVTHRYVPQPITNQEVVQTVQDRPNQAIVQSPVTQQAQPIVTPTVKSTTLAMSSKQSGVSAPQPILGLQSPQFAQPQGLESQELPQQQFQELPQQQFQGLPQQQFQGLPQQQFQELPQQQFQGFPQQQVQAPTQQATQSPQFSQTQGLPQQQIQEQQMGLQNLPDQQVGLDQGIQNLPQQQFVPQRLSRTRFGLQNIPQVGLNQQVRYGTNQQWQ